MIVVYVIGLPVGILSILVRHRGTLFGANSEDTMRKFGFLYDSYGESAWFWEVEELVRKLLLTAVAVLMDAGSPLQVRIVTPRCCSVMVSGLCVVLTSCLVCDRIAGNYGSHFQ